MTRSWKPFGALVLAVSMFVGLGACAGANNASSQSRAEHKESEVTRHQKQLPGEYSCRFELREETLDDASCQIDDSSGAMQLSMSGGDHRLSGDLSATDTGFRFVGEYSCTTRDNCKEPIETDFFEQGTGQYQSTVAVESGKLLSITLEKR